MTRVGSIFRRYTLYFLLATYENGLQNNAVLYMGTTNAVLFLVGKLLILEKDVGNGGQEGKLTELI